MNNKEFIQKFFKGREVTRPPFIPLVGNYITKVDQITPEELYIDSGNLVSAVCNTQQLLGYDVLMMPIDTTIEAEALGASVEWNDSKMPAIHKKITIDQQINSETIQDAGRIPVILDAVERMEMVNGKEYPIIVTLTGPFTILKQLYNDEHLQELEPEIMEEKLEIITQSLVQLCKQFGDKKASGILLYEDTDINSFQVSDYKQFYSPVFNVIKYYNIFGILRVNESIKEMKSKISDTVIGSQKFLLDNKFRTKGISVEESFWDVPFDQHSFRSLWHENKKRRLFLSTSNPLDLHIELPKLQEKISHICNPSAWV